MKAQTGDKHLVGKEFVITREYDAPRELVWLACTDAKHLAQWWGPRGFTAPVCEWAARPGSRIYVVMRAPNGTDYPMGGEFLEVVPPEKLVTLTGALDEKADLRFEFRHTLTLVELDGKTKLTMRSRLMRVIAPDAAQYIGGFEAGMTQSLERLRRWWKKSRSPWSGFSKRQSRWSGARSRRRRRMSRWYFDLKTIQAGSWL